MKKQTIELFRQNPTLAKLMVEQDFERQIREALKEAKKGNNNKIKNLFQAFIGFTRENANESEEVKLLKPQDPYKLINMIIKGYPAIVNIKIKQDNQEIQMHPLLFVTLFENNALFELLIKAGADINQCTISSGENNLTLIGELLSKNQTKMLDFIFENVAPKTYKISISELNKLVSEHSKIGIKQTSLLIDNVLNLLKNISENTEAVNFKDFEQKLTKLEKNVQNIKYDEKRLVSEFSELLDVSTPTGKSNAPIKQEEMKELENASYVTSFVRTNWNKFQFIDCAAANSMNFNDYKTFYPHAKEITEAVEKSAILLQPNAKLDFNSQEAILLYSTIKTLSELDKLDFMNYSNRDKSIFEKATNFKCFEHLEVMLKALNNIELNDNNISLIELIIKSTNKYPNLLKVFVTKHGVDVQDGKGQTLLDYAEQANDFISINYLQKYKELQEKLKLSQESKITRVVEIEEEKFKLLPENNEKAEKKQQKQAVVEEKKNIFKEIFESQNETGSVGQICFEKGVPIDEYKKFVSSENEQNESEEIIKSDIIQTWQIGETIYSSRDMLCHEHLGKKWYFMTKFILNEQQLISLDKGFVTQSMRENGIKLFDKSSIIEIKTSLEERAYTDCGYENSQGAVLVIFDKSGNHKEVRKNAKVGKLELIKVDTAVEEAFSIQELEVNDLNIGMETNVSGDFLEN